MMHARKKNVLGVLIDVTGYDGAVKSVISAARARIPFAATALAVHGLMTGVFDKNHRYRLNSLNLVLPDGQPVRWALNWLYGAGLKDRVYGPKLTLSVCERAEKEGLPVYFYGSTPEILEGLKQSLLNKFPHLVIAGMEASKFRRLSVSEKDEVAARIRASGASIAFVGLGCPRQEVWCYEFRECLSMPVLAVGAAFPFLAGSIRQAPAWMQRRGLEWLFRLSREPGRLWKRYVFLNPAYVCLLLLQAARIIRFESRGKRPLQEMLFG